MAAVGRVAGVRRYPVKSLVGEVLPGAEVGERGLHGDRLWAIVDPDGKLGSGKSSKRFRRMDGLLDLTAGHDGQDAPVIAFPDGRRVSVEDPRVHDALSEHVGRPVRLCREGSVSYFDGKALHLVTTASLAALARTLGTDVAVERFRPNLLVDVPEHAGLVEDGWVGRRLAIGPSLVVRVHRRTPRCVMVDLPQRGLPPGGGILETLGRLNDATFGVEAEVVTPGLVTVGDTVDLLD